jgi:hypothetical protein
VSQDERLKRRGVDVVLYPSPRDDVSLLARRQFDCDRYDIIHWHRLPEEGDPLAVGMGHARLPRERPPPALDHQMQHLLGAYRQQLVRDPKVATSFESSEDLRKR